MEKIISVKNLRKAYKKETAVENVCFELTPGSIMGLLGTNGAGKTTTLKMITNLCSKDNGKIVIDNVSLDENPGLALSKVGAALDTPSFYQELTARENIECFAHLYENIPNGQVMELLDYVGLKNQAEKKVNIQTKIDLHFFCLLFYSFFLLCFPYFDAANGKNAEYQYWDCREEKFSRIYDAVLCRYSGYSF